MCIPKRPSQWECFGAVDVFDVAESFESKAVLTTSTPCILERGETRAASVPIWEARTPLPLLGYWLFGCLVIALPQHGRWHQLQAYQIYQLHARRPRVHSKTIVGRVWKCSLPAPNSLPHHGLTVRSSSGRKKKNTRQYSAMQSPWAETVEAFVCFCFWILRANF